VLDNLLGNAIRHMGERSDAEIRIQVENEEDCICTSVSDNGIGIPLEYQSRIFDRFFRVPDDSGAKTGTGLGLSIVKKIVEGHKGRVWVESEPGKGAKFLFALPKLPQD
jgi:signal transduction histidine kinase